ARVSGSTVGSCAVNGAGEASAGLPGPGGPAWGDPRADRGAAPSGDGDRSNANVHIGADVNNAPPERVTTRQRGAPDGGTCARPAGRPGRRPVRRCSVPTGDDSHDPRTAPPLHG